MATSKNNPDARRIEGWRCSRCNTVNPPHATMCSGEVTSSADPASPAATPVRHRIILALPRPYRVLRGNHALAFLVTGQALSSLADWLLALALAVLAYTVSHSATIVALLTVTRLLPYGLVLPLAGAVLDRGTVLLVCRPRLRRMEDVLGLRAGAHGTAQIGR